ncbi:MAG: hypothetical protein JSW09_07670 [Pseudomonadota bacterium]|nr:MAG: hypothetical protein JSW09_07670 [Pseudomonadota bacterium]
MPMHEDPEVGAVYQDADGKTFEVRAFDENEGTIDVEYPDGSVETIELDAWYEMDLTQVESADEEEDEDLEADYDEDLDDENPDDNYEDEDDR